MESIRTILKGVPNPTTPSHVAIDRFCVNKFTSIYGRMVLQLNKCLKEANILEWKTRGKLSWSRDTRQKEQSPTSINGSCVYLWCGTYWPERVYSLLACMPSTSYERKEKMVQEKMQEKVTLYMGKSLKRPKRDGKI